MVQSSLFWGLCLEGNFLLCLIITIYEFYIVSKGWLYLIDIKVKLTHLKMNFLIYLHSKIINIYLFFVQSNNHLFFYYPNLSPFRAKFIVLAFFGSRWSSFWNFKSKYKPMRHFEGNNLQIWYFFLLFAMGI